MNTVAGEHAPIPTQSTLVPVLFNALYHYFSLLNNKLDDKINYASIAKTNNIILVNTPVRNTLVVVVLLWSLLIAFRSKTVRILQTTRGHDVMALKIRQCYLFIL